MKTAIDELVARERLLEDAGYRYSLRNEIYVNKAERKVFSQDFVEDHTDEELRGRIAEHNSSGDWKFYFTAEPTTGVKDRLIRLLSNGRPDG